MIYLFIIFTFFRIAGINYGEDHEEIMQVVIKEGELGSLAPLGGDESTIRAQQVFSSSHQRC